MARVKFNGVAVILIAILLAPVSIMGGPVLLWDATTTSEIAGYKVYFGTARGTYARSVDVGAKTSCSLDNLMQGVTQYIAVTAYSADGVESTFSDEVAFTPAVDGTATGSTPVMFTYTNAQSIVTFSARAGQQCRLVASSDLTTWQEVYSAAPLVDGVLTYAESAHTNIVMRVYRALVSPP